MVPVLHLLHDELIAEVVLGAAVDHAVRLVGAAKLDHVIHHDVGCLAEAVAHEVREPRLQCGAAALVAPDPDVLDEELGESVEVAHVDGEGVARGELPYRVERFQAIDALREIELRCHDFSCVLVLPRRRRKMEIDLGENGTTFRWRSPQ